MGMSAIFQGASGSEYTYLLTSGDNLKALSHQRGTFLFARGSDVLFAGEAHSLNRDFSGSVGAAWRMAREKHGANALYINIQGQSSPEERQKEVADLVEKHRPAMNISDQ